MHRFARLLLPFVVLSAVPSGEAEAADPVVEIRTSLGVIRAELHEKQAPATVSNFLQYANDGHYDGTIFHRVIDGFMIQGGGFDRSYRQKPTRSPIRNEAAEGVRAGLRNDPGTLAMARTSEPHSATAQFFINVSKNDFLNAGDPKGDGVGYAVFGRVISGHEVVTKIARLPTGPGGPFRSDAPREMVVIESVRLVPPAAGKK